MVVVVVHYRRQVQYLRQVALCLLVVLHYLRLVLYRVEALLLVVHYRQVDSSRVVGYYEAVVQYRRPEVVHYRLLEVQYLLVVEVHYLQKSEVQYLLVVQRTVVVAEV